MNHDTWYFSKQDANLKELTDEEELMDSIMLMDLPELRLYCNKNWNSPDDAHFELAVLRVAGIKHRLRGRIDLAMQYEKLAEIYVIHEASRIEQESEYNDDDCSGILDF
jgi:hypothetical protein